MFFIDYKYAFLCFIFTLIFSFILIKFFNKKINKSLLVAQGPQFIHEGEVSRFGGLAIFLTLGIMSIINWSTENEFKYLFLFYFIISIPTFFFGLLEDVTQSVDPKLRLFGSLISSTIFVILFDVSINNSGIYFLDLILEIKIISIIFTIICIIYMIQAFNVIDGLNGLSLGTAIICLLTVCIISYDLQNFKIMTFSSYLVFIFLGIFVFNFPLGKIFLGDGGAYLLGLCVSFTLIILFNENNKISPFVIAQILIYPAYEILRSFLRRLLSRKDKVFKADVKHIHSILYFYNLRKFTLDTQKANVVTSVQIIFSQIVNLFYIINFYESGWMMIIGAFIFISFYEILYKIIYNRRKV